jgi:hypothetical protein
LRKEYQIAGKIMTAVPAQRTLFLDHAPAIGLLKPHLDIDQVL